MLAAEAVGVVLAGGLSSRMGADKAALCLGNEPLLLRARRIFHETGLRRVYLSGRARLGWNDDSVPDLYPDFGPVGGMVSVLRTLVDSGSPITVLFMPVDTPLVSSAMLIRMLQNTHADGCYFDGSPLPLLLNASDCVLAQCTHAMAGFVAGRTCSVKQFIAPLKLARITANTVEQNQLLNVNTPNEWKALCCELENRT